jgi:hypothetical protein
MFWANRTNKIAGLTLLLLPLLSIVGFLAAGPTGNLDPFARGDVEALLRAVHDSQAIFVISMVPFILTDAIVLPAVAALLYLTFFDRSKSLALLGAFAILMAAVTFVVHEVGALTLPFLATDFLVEGGPAGIAAGNSVILQSARTVSIVQGLAALCGQTAMGLGITAFAVLLVWAPGGNWNPPRWLGALGLLAGVGMVCTWLFLLNHTAGGIATLVAETATMLMLTILGIWLLRQPAQPAGG